MGKVVFKRKYLNNSLRFKIFKRDEGTCYKCKAKTRFFKSNYDTPFIKDGSVAGSVDHVIPVSKGGTNDEWNLRWACRSCNCARGNKEC
jgi:5-methylcytosine-specific restriction endonuclease McrA